MIEQQIIDKLPPTASLQDVLQREKCLIVLDGLDEWTHPENSCTQRKEQIPHRYVIGNCVILTTARPLKLGVSNLKTRQISKQIELVQLNKESREQLEKNAIRKMNYGVGNEEVERKLRDFDREVTHRDLGHMLTIPLLLLYILCLWANKIHIGFSKHEIYRNIIELLLSKTAKKHPEDQTYNEPSDSFVREYFKKHKFCKKFHTLIMALAELAYHSLHNEERENMLVFDGTFVEKYLKIEDKKLCLLSGILTESRTKTVTQETSKVSFSHKTVQEYFAAIFICSQTDDQKTGVKYCRNVQDVLVISRFICDMNAKVMCSLSPDLISVINKDDETRSYRTRSGNEDIVDNPLYKLQNMLLSCFKQIPKSEHIQLYVHDFFINKDNIQDIQLQQVAKQNGNDIKSVYLNTRNTSKSIREVIDSFSLTYLNSIQKLCYFGDEIKDAEINRILFPSLQSLSLSSDTWTHYEGNLRENLKTLEKLQYLYIGRITMSHEELTSVLNFITSKTLLKQTELSRLYCKEHYRSCKRLNLDLSQHSHLTQLHLDNLPHLQLNMEVPSLVSVDMYKIYLGESSLVLSPLMLNIKFVMLSEIDMPTSTFERFVQVLENLPQSVRVYMSCCNVKPETKYERIDEYIKRSENFVVTDDDPENLMFYTIKPSKA